MATIDTRPPCKQPNCRARAVKNGHCEQHQQQAAARHIDYNRHGRNKEKLKVYNTQRWKKLSKRMIALHPLCTRCEAMGRIRPAQMTDHLYGFIDDTDEHAWGEEFLYPLCNHCHAIVTALEKRVNFLGMELYKAVDLKYEGAEIRPETKITL